MVIQSLCTETTVKLYCPEQIKIPEVLPEILKNYAKATIRTQPYDLLRWSCEYFRALANEELPMVKCRLEKDSKVGSLTKGYLRVLIDKVGRGFFINFEVLEKKWKALCLPQEELYKFLSLCRMLEWPQIHWLKLLAVMTASLNKSLMDTMEMLCSLLTNDLEGGPSRLPIWMFNAMYKFLADLDCSEEQEFMCGRKVLPDGKLEPRAEISELPYVLSTTSLKDAILDKCSSLGLSSVNSNDDLSSRCFSIGSLEWKDFKMLDTDEQPRQFLKKCENFDSLILYIQEHSKKPKLEDFDAPYNLRSDAIRLAELNEEKIIGIREKNFMSHADNIKKTIYKDHAKLMLDLGPPWSWIYEFANNNCIGKSYNLVELESVISDLTPRTTSDESFDFDEQKQIMDIDKSDQSIVSSFKSEEPPQSLTELFLIDRMKCVREDILRNQLKDLATTLKFAESVEKLDKSSSSYSDMVCREELAILKRASERCEENYLDIPIIINIVKKAEEEEIKFKSVDALMPFVEKKYFELYGQFVKPCSPKDIPEPSVSDYIEVLSDNTQTRELYATNYGAGSLDDTKPEDRICDEESKTAVESDGGDKASKVGEEKKPDGRDNLETTFAKSGFQPDQKVLSKPVDSEMILGVVDPPSQTQNTENKMVTLKKIANDKSDTESVLSEDIGPLSEKGYISGDSSVFVTTINKSISTFTVYSRRSSEISQCPAVKNFKCIIPVMPGIGPKILDCTKENFLSYMKFRAMQQFGFVMPINFKEEKCPLMVDP